MPAQAKLLIIEGVVPDHDREPGSKLLSLEMLVAASGKERTEAEYAGLLSRAGFRHTRTVHTVGTVAVVEAEVD